MYKFFKDSKNFTVSSLPAPNAGPDKKKFVKKFRFYCPHWKIIYNFKCFFDFFFK